jgi:hypothetical protein
LRSAWVVRSNFRNKKAGGTVQVVEYLPHKCEALGSKKKKRKEGKKRRLSLLLEGWKRKFTGAAQPQKQRIPSSPGQDRVRYWHYAGVVPPASSPAVHKGAFSAFLSVELCALKIYTAPTLHCGLGHGSCRRGLAHGSMPSGLNLLYSHLLNTPGSLQAPCPGCVRPWGLTTGLMESLPPPFHKPVCVFHHRCGVSFLTVPLESCVLGPQQSLLDKGRAGVWGGLSE